MTFQYFGDNYIKEGLTLLPLLAFCGQNQDHEQQRKTWASCEMGRAYQVVSWFLTGAVRAEVWLVHITAWRMEFMQSREPDFILLFF